ncbi:DUF1707 SHOCT-like domain-containing protein [Solicola sp. PLA-1-18]|uniref:DUF1707 SHOCT-like domain-containing protein n=1 Tax=Solicola sp. PLA-1-18 TaxID=3380532 RepID=UPI003B7E5801
MGDALTPGTFWSGFTRDPRDPSVSGLRMSDRDRAHLLDALGEAYADGRLDPEEHDERVGTAQSVKTFGEVPALITDLVPTTDLVRRASPDELRRRAQEAWRHDMRTSLMGYLGLSALLVAIYLLTSIPDGFYYFWPAWPLVFTAIPVAQTFFKHEQIVTRKVRRLTKQQDREQRRLKRGGS